MFLAIITDFNKACLSRLSLRHSEKGKGSVVGSWCSKKRSGAIGSKRARGNSNNTNL